MNTRVRPPAVAGRFFPSDAPSLAEMVDGFLATGRPTVGGVPKAVIAPHAGLVYSGPIAGSAFAPWRALRDTVRRVIVIGPSHHVGFDGVAASRFEAFRTPLGDVEVDVAGVAAALRHPVVHSDEAPHEREHSLETHLPFLQRIFDDFTIVPLVTGRAASPNVAALLADLWGSEETVVSVSSDLSHFYDYDAATQLDRRTTEAILELRSDSVEPSAAGACGAIAIRGLLDLARSREMTAEAVDVRNSGDTAGDRLRVVGYGAYAFYE